MTDPMRYAVRLVCGAGAIVFGTSLSAVAGGLLDNWSWAETPSAEPAASRVELSVGSYFGDSDPAVVPDLRREYGGGQSFWSSVVREKASDLLKRPGGGFAFINLPIDGIHNVKAIQVGVFDIDGLGAGFDDSGSQTIQIAHEKLIAAVIGECGNVIAPAQTLVETETQEIAATTVDKEKLSGVEFNVVLDDQATFGGMPGFQTFAGARFISYGDSYASAFSNGASGGDRFSDAQSLAVSNNLVGAQAGISAKKFLSPSVMVTGRLAAGLFANFSNQGGSYSAVADNGSSTAFADTSRDTGFAQMLEFSPALHVKVRDNMFLSFGGTVMLLNGVSGASPSTASEFETSGGRFDDAGTYLFYGGRATFNWTFN